MNILEEWHMYATYRLNHELTYLLYVLNDLVGVIQVDWINDTTVEIGMSLFERYCSQGLGTHFWQQLEYALLYQYDHLEQFHIEVSKYNMHAYFFFKNQGFVEYEKTKDTFLLMKKADKLL